MKGIMSTPKGMRLAYVPLNRIKIDAPLQREYREKHAQDIADNWDDDMYSAVNAKPNNDGTYEFILKGDKVFVTGTGTFHITDGQHRVGAAGIVGLTHLPMLIRMDMTREKAARVFALQDLRSARVDVENKADKLLFSGEPGWMTIKQITDNLDWDWATLPHASLQKLALHPTLGSPGRLRSVGNFVNEVWTDEDERTKADVLKGVHDFMVKYYWPNPHPDLDLKRLKEKASEFKVADLLNEAKQLSNGSMKYEKIDVARALRMRLVQLHDNRRGRKLAPRD